jgi:hypothetical protein
MRRASLFGGAFLLLSALSAGAVAHASDESFALDGNSVALSAHGRDLAPDHNLLVVSHDGRTRYRLAAQSIEIVYRRAGQKTDQEPDLIVTAYVGGAHCCYTVHVISIDGVVIDEKIPIRDSKLELDRSATPPGLRFYDFAFAYWNASFAESPAPLVVFAWDREARRYRPDIAAMRQPAPDEATLAASGAEVRAKLAASKPDRPDPALWGHMLDLIYAGNAAAALRFFDVAWPPARPGKGAFRAGFTRQLRSGELWRRYRLGGLLGTDAIFR